MIIIVLLIVVLSLNVILNLSRILELIFSKYDFEFINSI